MKTLLAILLVLLVATLVLPAQELPPLPPELSPQQIEMKRGDKSRNSMAKAERVKQAELAAKLPVPPALATSAGPWEHPETTRVRLTVERLRAEALTNQVKQISRPANRRGLSTRSPKEAAAKESSQRDRKMKPQAQSAAHEPGNVSLR